MLSFIARNGVWVNGAWGPLLLPRQYIHGDGGDPASPPRRLGHEAHPWVPEGGHHGRVGRGRAGYCVSLLGAVGSRRAEYCT